jgi:hypothetical protein
LLDLNEKFVFQLVSVVPVQIWLLVFPLFCPAFSGMFDSQSTPPELGSSVGVVSPSVPRVREGRHFAS